MGCKGVERGLSGGLGLHEEAEHRQHGKASILDLLQLQLLTMQAHKLIIKACKSGSELFVDMQTVVIMS